MIQLDWGVGKKIDASSDC